MTFSTPVANILPNGRTVFTDANSNPLSGGSVYYYIPATNTLKNTWSDPYCANLNTNPIILDSAGSAVVNGVGQYRQVVLDSLGNTIWDTLTNSVEGIGTLWCGVSSGGANLYQVTAPTSATTISAPMRLAFVPNFSNTNAAQIKITNASGVVLTTVNIYRQSGAGAVPTVGGEMSIGSIAELMFDGTQFQIINILSEPFSDGSVLLYNQADSTKQLKLNLSAIATGTTRTLNVPNANGTIALVETLLPLTDANPVIKNAADNTKLAKFDASAITTGTTRTYTFPDTSGTLALVSAPIPITAGGIGAYATYLIQSVGGPQIFTVGTNYSASAIQGYSSSYGTFYFSIGTWQCMSYTRSNGYLPTNVDEYLFLRMS